MAIEKEKNNIKINKPAIILIVSLGTVIGFAPFTLVLRRPLLLLYIFAGSIVLTFLAIRSKRTNATEPPGLGEFVLSGLGRIFSPASGGIIALVFYGLIYVGAKLVEWIANVFKLNVAINADLWAYYPTLVVLVLLIVWLLLGNAQEPLDQLYSKTAGIKSVFYDLLSKQGKRLTIRIIVIALILVTWIGVVAIFTHNFSSWWSNLVILLYLVLSTVSLATAGETAHKYTTDTDAVRALQKLYEASGFDVTLAPRTGWQEVDPLLVFLDMCAKKDQQGFGVRILSGRPVSDPSKTWTDDANMTMTAAWALEDFYRRISSPQTTIIPVLVFINIGQDHALKAWRTKNIIKTIVIPDTQEIINILNSEDETTLKQYASLYLPLSPRTQEGESKPKAEVSAKGVVP